MPIGFKCMTQVANHAQVFILCKTGMGPTTPTRLWTRAFRDGTGGLSRRTGAQSTRLHVSHATPSHDNLSVLLVADAMHRTWKPILLSSKSFTVDLAWEFASVKEVWVRTKEGRCGPCKPST